MASTKEDPIVNTLAGKIRGSVHRSIEGYDFLSFKGIPYAKPPVGQLRFQEPVPKEPWTGIKDAKNFGSSCAQLNIITKNFKGSDDCLYLNVYTKNLKPSKKQPVMFWIHGGGFMTGEGDDDTYGPDYLLRKDVVIVTINYRLGVFGFLSLEDEIAPGNYGLKDQVLALKWVRDNISNFGGDPDNVTVFGQSAGSAAVHYLSLSPLSKGLFHKAIMESGAELNPWAFVEDPKEYAYKLCDILGNNTRDHKKIIEFLRTMDFKRMIEAQDQIIPRNESLKTFPFGPGIDSKSKNPFMPIHPDDAAKQGVHVPLLIGYTSREGVMFYNSETKAEELERTFISHLHPRTLKYIKNNFGLTPNDLKRFYIKGGKITEENREILIDLWSDMDFVLNIHQLLKIQVERGSAPTYFYKYTYDKTQSPLKKIFRVTNSGACHTDELQHLFRMRTLEGQPVEAVKKESPVYKLMEKMTDLWVNFATTGRPTPTLSKLVPLYWQPINNGTVLRYLNIDEELRMDVILNLEEHLHFHEKTRN